MSEPDPSVPVPTLESDLAAVAAELAEIVGEIDTQLDTFRTLADRVRNVLWEVEQGGIVRRDQPRLRTPHRFDAWLEMHTQRDGECLVWNGGRRQDGYALANWTGSAVSARRLVWTHQHGDIPAGHYLVSAATCTHPGLCLNADHLEVVTAAEAVRRRQEEGRFASGEVHWNAKLTEAQARVILDSGESTAVLAERFGVHANTIRAIRGGRRWQHLREH